MRVSGWVTNNSDEVWTAVNVHAFIAQDPITTSSDLAFESTRGVEESVGDRITVPGTFDTIPELAPGASAPYTDRIPVDLLGADEQGVYWFGVHALGSNTAGRDVVADGRARTFLPLRAAGRAGRADRHGTGAARAPPGDATTPTAASATWTAGSTPSTTAASSRRSSTSGSPRAGVPLTWLVDPAVPDSASRIADGNPARELVEPEDEGGVGEGPRSSPVRRRLGVGRSPGAGARGGADGGRREMAGQAQPGGDRQAGPRPALG